MKKEEFEKQVKDLEKASNKILLTKTKDYNNVDADVFDLFKTVSNSIKELNIDSGTPQGLAMVMMLIKIKRFNNLANSKNINHESLKDTLLDLVNYSKLVTIMEYDKTKT